MDRNKPLFQLSCGEFVDLMASSLTPPPAGTNTQQKYVYGLAGLATLLGCSVPTAVRIKKSGILNAAISQIGRTIVIDADLALEILKNKA